MPRLFVGNFEFEQAFEASYQPSRSILQFCSELSTVWRSIAESDDLILVPLPAYVESLNEFAVRDFPHPRFLSEAELPGMQIDEIIPWGWTPGILKLCERLKFRPTAPSLQQVRDVNSRRFSFEVSRDLGCELPGEGIASSLPDIMPLIQACHAASGAWIIKPNHGQAGRGQIRGSGPFLTEDQFGVLLHMLSRHQVVAVEPLLESQLEVGCQWMIQQTGEIDFLGMTELLTDGSGHYQATAVRQSSRNQFEFLPELHDNMLSLQRKAVERIFQTGYFGPVGIDAMLYRDQCQSDRSQSDQGQSDQAGSDRGDLKVRPLQDINGRWTMGRIGWEWARRFGQTGEWRQANQRPDSRALALSPEFVGDTPFRTRTWWTQDV